MGVRRHRLLVLATLALGGGCATAPGSNWAGPSAALAPEAARVEARRSVSRDPVTAGARAWVEGNDRAAARRAFSEASEDDAAAALWSAWLAHHELDRERAMSEATRALKLAPDAPEGWAAAALIERLVAQGAALPADAAAVQPRGAIARALATRRAPSSGLDEASTFARGGWLVDWLVEGPVGPDDPIAFESWIEARRPPPAAPSAPVSREVLALGGRVTLAAGERPGLYVATSCFEAPRGAELWAAFPGRAELTVDGVRVERPDRETWRARLALSDGVHRLSVRVQSGPRDELFVVVGDARPAPCPSGPAATPARAAVEAILPTVASFDLGAATEWAAGYLRAEVAGQEPLASDEARERALAWVPERADASSALLAAWVEWAGDRAPARDRRTALEEAVRLDPASPAARVALGRAAWDDEGVEALQHFRAAAQAAPDHWLPPWLAHGWLAERGRAAAALEQLELALERSPPVWVFEDARRFLVQARRLERVAEHPGRPTTGDAWSDAAALGRAGRFGPASELAYPLARAAPTAERWADIARWELGRGAHGRAGAAAQRAIALDPLRDDAARTLLQATAALGDHETFVDTLAQLRRTGGADLQVELLAASVLGESALLEPPDSWVGRNLTFDPQPYLEPAPGRSEPRGVDSLEPWAAHEHVVLLDRVIDRVRPDGSVASEQHAIIRVQSRAAVDAFGEVAPPPNAILLDLKTIEPDGATLEADRHPGKADLSLPRLSPGDAVERRWLALESPSTPRGGYVRRFFFAGDAPTVRADLVVIVPDGVELHHRAVNGAPEPYVRREPGRTVHIWQSSSQPAVVREPFAAPAPEFLPHVVVWAGIDERRALGANLLAARRMTTPSAYVETRARAIVDPDASDDDRLASLEAWIRGHIDSGPPRPPLETLLARSGSRTALLVAMARAVGVDAELVALRPGTAARVRSAYPDPSNFELLAGRARLGGRLHWWLLDDGMDRAGALPAELRGGSYVVARRDRPVPRPIEDAWIDTTPQSSALVADLRADGTLTGTLTWTLGDRHAAELVEFERRVAAEDRPRQLEHVLGAAWPGIRLSDVRIDSERSTLRARVEWPGFAHVTSEGLRIDDLFAELPLGRVFGDPGPADFTSLTDRQTPLLVRESRELLRVRLRLPAGLEPRERPRSFRRVTPFGSFERRTHLAPDRRTLELFHARWLPQIRVQPEDYGAFRQTLEVVVQATREGMVLVPH